MSGKGRPKHANPKARLPLPRKKSHIVDCEFCGVRILFEELADHFKVCKGVINITQLRVLTFVMETDEDQGRVDLFGEEIVVEMGEHLLEGEKISFLGSQELQMYEPSEQDRLAKQLANAKRTS